MAAIPRLLQDPQTQHSDKDLLYKLKDCLQKEHDEVKTTVSLLASMRQGQRQHHRVHQSSHYENYSSVKKDPGKHFQ